METNREVIVKKLGGTIDIIVPKGTTVSPIKGGGGKTYYTICPSIAYKQYPKLESILRHDFKYHYLFVPNDCVDLN